MGNFAKVENGFVVNVIVADQDFIDSLEDKDSWIETDVNAFGGNSLRKNFGSVGFTYDKERDAFIPPKMFQSWILNEDTCQWEPPTPYPNDDKIYIWNEEILNWELINNG